MDDASAAIEVQDVRKIYGDKAAVDGLSLTVPRGCFFGFLGPNGAGKTTTIKMLMGLAPATSGSIRLLGLPMPERSLEIKGRIGLVPDESLLFDHLTGGEFIEFAGRIYGLDRPVARERARELLELFELDSARNKLIAEYSKGMRKRVAMAAALIHRPELFLMDEPFEGVDAVGARLMKDILLEQVRHGATIFLTSHVLEVVERLCDRVAIIHEGKLVREGSMAELRGSA
ncbi:MAG TPA: ABC transporter ATP-binding protein, partial [Bryobacteraceae bacterium]|nr:ABC transporter ATP-binding protein [Bryobacteraceae bacterium]